MIPGKILGATFAVCAAACCQAAALDAGQDQMTPRNSLSIYQASDVTFVGVVELGQFIHPAPWVEETGARVECNGPDVAAMEFQVLEVLWGTPPDGPLLFQSGGAHRPSELSATYEKYLNGRPNRVILSTVAWSPPVLDWRGTSVQPSTCGYPPTTTFYMPRIQQLHPDGSARFLARAADVYSLWSAFKSNGRSDDDARWRVDHWEGWQNWNEGRTIALEHYAALGPSTAVAQVFTRGGRPASAPADPAWFIQAKSYCYPDPATGRPTVCSWWDGQCTVVGEAQ